jgi:Tfp pilus assembly protein PilF
MSQSFTANRTKWPVWIICGALVFVTLAVYMPVLKNDFINLDDTGYVYENPKVKAGLSMEGFAWASTTTVMSNWHPLTWISHQTDCQIYGLKPWGHHLTSLLLHVANTVLLMLVLVRMTGAVWRSAFVAAVFAWHPLHVESVAWVSERKDVLCAFFWLLTMLAYAHYVRKLKPLDRTQRPEEAGVNLHFALALLLFALGLMSKPMVVTLPLVLLLMDYWPLGRIARSDPASTDGVAENPRGNNAAETCQAKITWKMALKEKLPFFGLSLASCLITILAQRAGGAVATFGQSSLRKRIAVAILAYCRYVGKTLWPGHLSAYYPPSTGTTAVTVLCGLVFLGVVSLVAYRAWRKERYVAAGWLWFLGTLVPVIGLVQVGSQSIADRYTYIPMVGLLIMIAWTAERFTKNWPMRATTLGFTCAILFGAYLTLTWRRVEDWRNSGTLFRQALLTTPDQNFMAEVCLGIYLSDEGNNAEAIEHFKTTLAINPEYPPAQYRIGKSLAAEGKWQEAAEHLMEDVRLSPNIPLPRYQLGFVLTKLGKKVDAMAQYRLAVQLDPSMAHAWLNLGDLLAESGDFQNAEFTATKARETGAAAGQQDLVEAANKRLEAFRAGKPYNEK